MGRHHDYRLPGLDFAGSPLGIDLRAVVDTGHEPVVTTGIAHREPGIGQIGAGLTTPRSTASSRPSPLPGTLVNGGPGPERGPVVAPRARVLADATGPAHALAHGPRRPARVVAATRYAVYLATDHTDLP
ncbi:hypothetical protein GA0115252_12181, partial [Streptomyces sp. DfronAA-171]